MAGWAAENDQEKLNARLLTAVRKGDLSTATSLLDRGANLGTVDDYKQGLLIVAARRDKADMCELLVRRGIDVNQVDRMQRSALFHAVGFRKLETAKRLLELGADVDGRAASSTPLDLAMFNDDDAMCRLLVEKGARQGPPDAGSISIGSVHGGDCPNAAAAIKVISDQARRLSSANPWNAKGHLQFVVGVGATTWQPDHFGVRKELFLRRKRIANISFGMLETPTVRDAVALIVPAMAEAWAIATPLFAKARIAFDSDNAWFVIESIAATERLDVRRPHL